MREFKFRAWDIDARRMIPWEKVKKWPFESVDHKDIILMEFTGLHDKNGKEIWEGDIVRVQSQYETDEPVDSSPNKVYFRDGAFRCGFHDMILGEKVCSGSEGNWNMEVIGNIYENPELLEGTHHAQGR